MLDYRTLWRWHFYAGLFCIPFVVLLALTGAIYLFKPQLEAAADRDVQGLVLAGSPASAGVQVAAAGTHDQAVDGRETEGGGHALTVDHGRHAGAVAEMGDDDTALGAGGVLGQDAGDVLVG